MEQCWGYRGGKLEKKVGNNKNNGTEWASRGVESWKGKWEIIKIMEQCWHPEVWKVGKESGK